MSVVPLEKGKARIRFDDGTEVVLYKGEIRKLGIEEGCVVTEAVYDKILNEILGKRAIKRAMHLLEKQDRTERQLYDKLKQNGCKKLSLYRRFSLCFYLHPLSSGEEK